MTTNYYVDYGYNAPASFMQMDTPYSPAFPGTKEEYQTHMESTRALFDNAKVYDVSFINSSNNTNALDFISQQNRWKDLTESLKITRNGKGHTTTLVGFDFETLMVDVAHPYKTSPFSAVTELGIAKTIVNKTNLSKKSTEYSIAGGINEEQLKKYLELYKQFEEKGLNSFDNSERKMIESTMERFSRYGQSTIEDLFEKNHIAGIGDVITVKSLGDSKTFNPNYIARGISHLAVLGGISDDTFMEAASQAGITSINRKAYTDMQKSFANAGLTFQTLDRKSELTNKIVNYFNKVQKNNDAFIMGFNSNAFDLNIYRNFIGDNLTKDKVLDIFTALKKVGLGHSQEKIAKMFGISFSGVAHTAGPDARVTTEIAALTNVLNDKSLPQLISETAIKQSPLFGRDKQVFYALNSISLDKNGSDYFNGNMYNVSGVQRGRYYTIGETKMYEDGRFAIEFKSAAEGTDDVFVKVFDSVEEGLDIVRDNFSVQNINRLPKKLMTQNEYIVNADKARRNYENLYSPESISYSAGKYEGGYERLNQYYRAYNIASKQIGEIDESVIQKIAESSDYDEQIITSLKQEFGEDGIYDSLIRDFKAVFGRIHDEAPMLEYMTSKLDATNLNTYQKTIVVNEMRKTFTDMIENSGMIKAVAKNIAEFSYVPSERDMFAMDIKMADNLVNVNFANTENAIRTLTRNFYSNSGKNATKIQVANSMIDAVSELYGRGLVDYKFLKNFYSTAGVENTNALELIRNASFEPDTSFDEIRKVIGFNTLNPSEIQPRKLVEMLVGHIQESYVTPIQNKGFIYDEFAKKNFSRFNNDERLMNFFIKKTKQISGSEVVAKARSNRYQTSDGIISTIGEAFKNITDKDSIANGIISDSYGIKTVFDKKTFEELLINNLGYSKTSAEETSRMVFTSYKSGAPFGIATYKTKNYKNQDKVKYITQFAYSGDNKDAFLLINENNGRSVSKIMGIMGDTSMSFMDKINLIKDEGYASVLPLKAINKFDIDLDTNDSTLQVKDVNGNTSNISFDTLQNGNKGYVKVSQNKIDFWDQGVKNTEDSLEHLRLNLTDDATVTSSNFRKMRKDIVRILDDDTLPISERNKIVSGMFSKANNNVLSNMPGPSGYQTLYIPDRGFTVTLAPSVADFLQSSHLHIQPFEILALEVAKKDVLNNSNLNSRKVAETFLNLAGVQTDSSTDYEYQLNKLITKAKTGESISAEFDEYFYKHFANVPMGVEENFAIQGVRESKFTIIDYLKDRKGQYKLHEDTVKVIDWLSNNKFSQFTKESAAQDKKILGVQNLLLNQYSFMDPSVRPTSNQIQGAQQAVVSQLKEDFSESLMGELQIKIGYDATTLQRAEFDKAVSDYGIFENIHSKDLTDAITTNVKQMDSTEIIAKFIDLDKNFNANFEDTIQDAARKYGISQADSEYLLQVAFNVMKNRSANVYESRGIARPAFAQNSLFTSPEKKTIEMNPIDESELEYLRNSKAYQDIFSKNYIKRGTQFTLSNGDVRTYKGPSGVIENIDDFLTTGKTGLFEATIDANGEVKLLPNVGSTKYFIGYEKGMLYTPEFDTIIGKDFINKLGNIDIAESAYVDFLDKIFVKAFGNNVAAVGDFAINKHRTKGITFGGYMNTMFYHVNKYMDETGDNKIFTELSNIFTEADPYGLKLSRYNGRNVYDPSQLGQHGVFGQIETVITKIQERAANSDDKYQKIWSNIAKEIEYNEANNIFRTAINIGRNSESMGGAMNFDSRMELMLRMQGKGDLKNYIEVEGGKKVSAFDYIADMINLESVNNLKDTSLTPIKSNYRKIYASAKKTEQGLMLSAKNMANPEDLLNSNIVLDIDLKDIKIDPSSSDPSQLTKHSIFKLMDNDGAHYSDFLREQAIKANKNIDDIVALRINFGDDISFDIKNGKNSTQKNVNQLLVPLYDLTPFKDKVYYDQRLRDLNHALQVAKDYGRTKGLDASKKDLNKAIEQLYTGVVRDLNPQDKMSYVSQRLLRTPMKNSRMLHADSSIVPALNVMTDDYTKWLAKNNEDYRKEILSAIKTGDTSKYDIDVSTTKLTGREYTTTIDGKLYYDDIVEMSKEGFEQIGVDFRATGQDIFFNKANYVPKTKQARTDFFDEDYLTKIAKRVYENNNSSEVLMALKSQKECERLFKIFKNKDSIEKYRIHLINEETKEYKKRLDNIDKNTKIEIETIVDDSIKRLKSDFDILSQGFEEITEDYLSKVGTFGVGLRYPVFYMDSEGVVKLKLNNTLQRDEMVVSGVFGHKINMDHDADKGVIKAFIDSYGRLVNRGFKANNKIGNYTYVALEKAYGLRVYNDKNNKEMAGMIEKVVDKIDNSIARVRNGVKVGSAVDYISDLANGNISLKRISIDGDMLLSTRNDLLTELKLENLIGVEVRDYTPEQVNTVFNAWSNKFGNMLNNMENIAASSKARITKNQIGSISNINYTLNQVLYESLDQAIQQNDTASITKYNDILKVLHSGSEGLLPATEQKGIDVKHAFDGFLITETRKYNQGIKKLFSGNYNEGIKLIEEGVKNKIIDSGKPEDVKKWNEYMKAISDLAKDKRANTVFKHLDVAKNIDSLDTALKFMENAKEYENYVTRHGLTSSTAVRGVLDAISEIKNQFTMGYYHNDIMQIIHEDAVMISLEDGTPVLYRVHRAPEKVKNKKGMYSLGFDVLNSNNEWESVNDIIVGSPTEIQTIFQQKFGSFKSYGKETVTRDIKGFRKKINAEASIINANKFANMYSRGNTKMANNFLTALKKSNSKASVDKIQEYLDFVKSPEKLIEFSNKLSFIQNTSRYQTKEAFKNQSIDDILANINKQIIERGKNKRTNTTIDDILNKELLKVANDISTIGPDSAEFQNFVKSRQEALSNIFKGYEEKVIDINKARKDLSGHSNSENAIEKILNSYKEENNKYFKSLNIKPLSMTEMDTMFNWNSNNLENMRVGIQTDSGLYGRKFSDLTQADVDEIMNYTNRGKGLSQYAYDTTKAKLMEYQDKHSLSNLSPLQGAREKDIISLKDINDTLKESAETAQEGLNAKGKKFSKEQAGELVKKTLNGAKEFAKAYPKITTGVAALAALGLVSNLLSNDNESPLVPELNRKESTGPINNSSINAKAPSSNTGRKTIYTDPSSGLQYKMSASSKRKVNQMAMAKQLSSMTEGDTNVNIYDDRSQVSNNWLERKFSELV